MHFGWDRRKLWEARNGWAKSTAFYRRGDVDVHGLRSASQWWRKVKLWYFQDFYKSRRWTLWDNCDWCIFMPFRHVIDPFVEYFSPSLSLILPNSLKPSDFHVGWRNFMTIPLCIFYPCLWTMETSLKTNSNSCPCFWNKFNRAS